jgi:phage baseplate assembly protein gpV
MSALAPAETDRRIANLVELGSVAAIDVAANTATVDLAGFVSDPLPVLQIRSGVIKAHWMPSVGEQVAVVSPGGDLARGFIIGSLPIAGNAVAPNAETPTLDLGGGTLKIIGNLEVVGEVKITGPVAITGDVSVTGKLTATDDVIAAGKSLKSHKHGQVQAGSAQSGGPV